MMTKGGPLVIANVRLHAKMLVYGRDATRRGFRDYRYWNDFFLSVSVINVAVCVMDAISVCQA